MFIMISLAGHILPNSNEKIIFHLSKLSGGQQVVRPLLNVVDGNVEPAFEVNLRSLFPIFEWKRTWGR